MKHALPIVAASLALALSACSSTGQHAPAPNFTQVEAAAGDALLTTEVKAKLITVDINSTASLGVRVSGGVATLSGSVRAPADRVKMVATARSVPGITEVVDQLRVNPRQPDLGRQLGQAGQQLSDAALAGRIAGAIFTQTGITGVKVDVHNGNVTLRGNVVDPKVRTAAVDTARNTSGVHSVTDAMGT